MLLLALVAAGVAFGGAEAARAETASPSDPTAVERLPLAFYLAKGEANSCGEGCNEWIAAEGYFTPGSAQRMRTFLKRHSGRSLPIFFQSPAGIQAEALAIGRLMREREMTAGVAKTVPQDCVPAGEKEKACRASKQSGRTLMAELRSVGAACNSACVYALIGAKVRLVPPGGRLGVHSGKFVRIYSDGRVVDGPAGAAKAALAGLNAGLRRYVNDMGIGEGFLDVISRVPYEKVHYLSRNEIADFHIDARVFLETPWTVAETSSPAVLKFVVAAAESNQSEFRTDVVRLACRTATHLTVAYLRGVAGEASASPTSISLMAGGRNFAFSRPGRVAKMDAIDTGGWFEPRVAVVPVEFFEAAAAVSSIEITESAAAGSTTSSRVLTLSTVGLSQAVGTLRQRCESAI